MISVKNFAFEIEDIKAGKKTFSVNDIEKSDIKSFRKKGEKTCVVLGIMGLLGCIPFIVINQNCGMYKILEFCSFFFTVICLIGIFFVALKDTNTLENIRNLYFVHNLKDNEKDIEKLSIELSFVNEFSKCKINIETKNSSIKPYYNLYGFKIRPFDTLENSYIIDFNKKEILFNENEWR